MLKKKGQSTVSAKRLMGTQIQHKVYFKNHYLILTFYMKILFTHSTNVHKVDIVLQHLLQGMY